MGNFQTMCSCEGNSEGAETAGIKPFFTSPPLHASVCKMNGQTVVGKPHYQRVIWIVVRKIVSTWPIHWEKGMQDGWLRGLCCSYTFVPSLPFFFIRHTRTRWRNVMEKPFECIMCTANGLQKTCCQNTISATIIFLCPVNFK